MNTTNNNAELKAKFAISVKHNVSTYVRKINSSNLKEKAIVEWAGEDCLEAEMWVPNRSGGKATQATELRLQNSTRSGTTTVL